MVKLEQDKIISCMLENKDKDGEIVILEHSRTGEIEVEFFEIGLVDTYCWQNQREVVERFSFCPSDRNYDTTLEIGSYEEGSYEYEDAVEELESKEFNGIELV